MRPEEPPSACPGVARAWEGGAPWGWGQPEVSQALPPCGRRLKYWGPVFQSSARAGLQFIPKGAHTNHHLIII